MECENRRAASTLSAFHFLNGDARGSILRVDELLSVVVAFL
jgi:hypothetical protein